VYAHATGLMHGAGQDRGPSVGASGPCVDVAYAESRPPTIVEPRPGRQPEHRVGARGWSCPAGQTPAVCRGAASCIVPRRRRGSACRWPRVAGRIVCSGEGWGSEAAGDRNRRSASLCDGIRCHACNEEIGRITVASFGVAITAGHTGRDPSFDLGLQPPHRVRGELAPGRKLPRTLQTPECRPRQSRARADLSASEKAGVRAACAGCSDASVPSSLTRALPTSADATRWRIKVATLRASR
jgi:hypothetical protein